MRNSMRMLKMGATTMRAATVLEHNKPLVLKTDVPIPRPGPNQLLVKITASSLCMSDIAGYMGHLGSLAPFCAGHEPVGIVEQLGPGVMGFSLGERVGFMPASRTCQNCGECLSGNHRFCTTRTNVGFDGPYGGFSEYCLADPLSTIKIPASLSDDHAAPLLCAGVTAYSALKKVSKNQPGGSWLNIIGIGGVGHLAVAYARAMGYRVTAYDITQEKLNLAKEYGAEKAFNSLELGDTEVSKTYSTIVISGAAQAYDLAFRATIPHGTVFAVGVPPHPIPLNILSMIMNDQSLVSTCQGSKQELAESLQLAADNGIKPKIELRKIDQINEGYQEMLSGKVLGRLLYKFD